MNLKKLATGMLCMFLAMFSTMAFAQSKEITGKVTDSKDGTAIAGISVQGVTASGKKIGTATSSDGTFKLSSADGIVKVTLTGVGFDRQEVNVTGKTDVAVLMEASNTSLNEVVVIGYGTARKKDLTGAVSTVQAKDFNKGTYTSADQLIQGKVAGVQMINNSGAPGGASTVKIRGNSTPEVAKKSYTIKFVKKVGVLGMGKAKKWVLNANAFDKSLLRNKLVFDFASLIGLEYTPESTFADVWLNGKFIGNYLLSELVEVSPSRVNIDTDKGDFLIEREAERVSEGITYLTTPIFGSRFGVNEPEDITKEQLMVLTNFLEKVEMAIQARDWELFASYVDEKSYIDYYILSELFKVVDFDYASTRFYIKNNKLYAGPTWDYDLSSGNADDNFYYNYNYHEGFGSDSSYIGLWCNANLYRYCYEFPEFTAALRVRYKELQEVIKNLYEDNSIGTNQIDFLLEKNGKSFASNYNKAGWTFTQDFILERIPETTYEQNVEYLRGGLKKRNEFLLNSFE